jgi:integrase
MRNLPEGAGSPISRMPQSTKGGLRPTHQPNFTVYHNFPEPKPTKLRFSEVKFELPHRNQKPRRVIASPLKEQTIIANEAPIINLLIQMKNDNKSDYTINFTRKALTFLAKHTSLTEPEAVKHLIAQHNVSDGYKRNLCIAYNRFCKFYKIKWQMPLYLQEAKNITVPTKEKLSMLIAEAGKTLSTKLSISMETGLRPVELCRLKVKAIDLEHKVINPTTAKRGNPRTLPISESLKQKLHERIIQKNLRPNDLLFKGTDPDHYGKQYRAMRNKLAEKLKDPSIRTIRLYDFRHYFCTKKLNDIGNPYTVMVLMGHKKLETTQRYMHLLNFNDDEWNCVGATTAKEAAKLIEAGFQYVTTIEGIQLFKKRK